MAIKLSDRFTYKRLLKFTLPSIVMMIFTSVYGVVDGFFVSNYAGKVPFAAVNLIMPFIMIMSDFGFIFGTGGSALVGKLMGEGNREKANKVFSLIVYTVISVGALFTVIGLIAMEKVAVFLGADEEMLDYCVTYGRIVMVSTIPFMLQTSFQSFMVTAERPRMGLAITVVAGVTNMVLDFLFVGVFKWGVVGAAWATVTSEYIGGLTPLIYFLRPNDSPLRLGKTEWDGGALLQTCWNGSSEFVSNMSRSLVNMLYNFQLMKYAGSTGVAAYGVIMYVNFIFISIFIGYAIGVAPVVSFNYGAENHNEMKSLFRKSLRLIAIFAVTMTAVGQLLARPIAGIFVGYDEELMQMTISAFRIYAMMYLVSGFNINGSAFFTALNNGKVSAIISFLRTLVFQSASVMLLPLVFGVTGIWCAVIVAELMAITVTTVYIIKMKDVYHYM